MNLAACLWELDRLAGSSVLDRDCKRAAAMAAYIIREADIRPTDVTRTIEVAEASSF